MPAESLELDFIAFSVDRGLEDSSLKSYFLAGGIERGPSEADEFRFQHVGSRSAQSVGPDRLTRFTCAARPCASAL